MYRFYFLNFFRKKILVFLLIFVSSMSWGVDKPTLSKKISRNISSVESVMCPNDSPAPSGNIEFCPKCKSGSYRLAEGCPNEGGTGDSCPQGGCNGGMPIETSSSN